MNHLLKSLRDRRKVLEARIAEEQARPAPDSLRLRALKTIKLRFRDRIEFLERLDRNGQGVLVPVIRRRSRKAPMSETA